MAQPLSAYFLNYTLENLAKANEHLGRELGSPGGAVDPDSSEQDLANHAALVELTEALENFQNWAVELNSRLQAAGIVDLVLDAP